MNRFVIALLTASAISALAIPAQADPGNTGTSQNVNQGSVITGDGNTSINEARQDSTNVRRGARGGDDATIQNADQSCDIVGNSNTCVNRAQQTDRKVREGRGNNRTIIIVPRR